ncbi:hypothetical protein CKO_01284 [Citrobacter koseri ATCC BAA-895]|uniref:Uncharacterized protein n=1 Tax=Citrobacter koseri (strain ATCC BAA-895 / CDC 4225-83 / SGSC4696) TaxID=290338 RepID=A8AG12_CITK8|nr:hypothetical protein CKO_01284 [Citrobacter koseri ATCC BAA-895]
MECSSDWLWLSISTFQTPVYGTVSQALSRFCTLKISVCVSLTCFFSLIKWMWQRSEQRTITVSPPNNFKLAFTNAIFHPVLENNVLPCGSAA